MLKYFLMSALLAGVAATITYFYYATTISFRCRHRKWSGILSAIVVFGSAFAGIRLMGAFFRQQETILSHAHASLVMLTFAIVWAAGCIFTGFRIHRMQQEAQRENI